MLGHLTKINDHLAQRGTRFLTGDTMCCFDCELMPRLQHIRVAGKYFVDFEIPVSLPFTTFVFISCHFRVLHRLVKIWKCSKLIYTLEKCAIAWKRNNSNNNNNMTCEIECVTLEHVTWPGCVNIYLEFCCFVNPQVHLTALWRYMYHMYQLDAFTQSCPADQDIINHYKLQQVRWILGIAFKRFQTLILRATYYFFFFLIPYLQWILMDCFLFCLLLARLNVCVAQYTK